jgi:hypothetical protein
MLVNASVEPTERSNPPASITKVRPIEVTQRIDDEFSSAERLSIVKKRSWVMAKTAIITASKTSTTKKRCLMRLLN